MAAFLRGLIGTLAQRPRAVVVVSGHWEEPGFAVNTAPRPSLLFDYYGFPPHTYELKYPAPGEPALAERFVGELHDYLRLALPSLREPLSTVEREFALARAYLTGTLRDVSGFDAKDIRRAMPRFAPATYAANLALLAPYAAIAQQAGCSQAQLALAWLLRQGDDIIPIPGTTRLAHLEENLGAVDVRLDAAACEALARLFDRERVAGERYGPAAQAEVDTEQF